MLGLGGEDAVGLPHALLVHRHGQLLQRRLDLAHVRRDRLRARLDAGGAYAQAPTSVVVTMSIAVHSTATSCPPPKVGNARRAA
eukprot:5330772-Prymnesium_polylepis.2